MISYDDLEEVIRKANDSEFGLGGTIWTSNPDRAVDVAMRLETGTVWINKHLDIPFDVSFGGAKQSGLGREQGLDGVKEFTQAKVIHVVKA